MQDRFSIGIIHSRRPVFCDPSARTVLFVVVETESFRVLKRRRSPEALTDFAILSLRSFSEYGEICIRHLLHIVQLSRGGGLRSHIGSRIHLTKV